jgi:hypothetical protein
MASKAGSRADLRDDVRTVTATRKCRGDRRSAKRTTLCGLKQLMLLHHAEDELRCGDQGVLAKVGLGRVRGDARDLKVKTDAPCGTHTNA